MPDTPCVMPDTQSDMAGGALTLTLTLSLTLTPPRCGPC